MGSACGSLDFSSLSAIQRHPQPAVGDAVLVGPPMEPAAVGERFPLMKTGARVDGQCSGGLTLIRLVDVDIHSAVQSTRARTPHDKGELRLLRAGSDQIRRRAARQE